MITIYRIVAAYMLVGILIQQFMPLIGNLIPPPIASQYNVQAMEITSVFNGQQGLFSTVMQQSFGTTAANGQLPSNSTGTGFFAGITIFSGLAFVFSTIGYIMFAIINVPRGMEILMNVALNSLGFSIYDSTLITSLIFGFVTFSVVMIGISSWMKYDLLRG
jgi:hypothetical protein